jgi:hypothetical protein
MENRKPFKLRKLIVFYNFLQVLLSFYLCYEVATVGWFGGYNWRCQPVDHSRSEKAMRVRDFLRYFKGTIILNVNCIFINYQMAAASWLYYFSKFTEFFDTFFFVLRKRYDQVSTLHVIHHGIMPFSGKNINIFI